MIAGRVEKIKEFPLDDSPATRPYKITRLQGYRVTVFRKLVIDRRFILIFFLLF